MHHLGSLQGRKRHGTGRLDETNAPRHAAPLSIVPGKLDTSVHSSDMEVWNPEFGETRTQPVPIPPTISLVEQAVQNVIIGGQGR